MKNIFDEEKDYLEQVNKCLTEEEEDCRKDMLEIPKRYTNTLQGDSFLVESLMSSTATKLRKLELAEKKPYFGRIDFDDIECSDTAKIYIGKTTIHDKESNTVTTDWRTPICSLYYDGDIGNVEYEAPSGTISGELKLKRQIIIEDSKLVDVLDTSLVSSDELLQPYLSVNADNKMKTIIASIQKEQNRIIRKPISDNIIVQGVAGSGKTSVALHRIAYLVFNYEKKVNSKQFLVIGPNKYFLNYISSILPELETEPVEQETYADLVKDIIKDKISLDNKTDIFNMSGNKEMYKKIQSFKTSLSFKKALDCFMKDYLTNNIVLEGFEIDGQEVFSAESIRNLLYAGSSTYPNFENAYTLCARSLKNNMDEIYNKLNKKYRMIYTSALPKDDPRRVEAVAKSTELNKILKKDGIKLLKNYFKRIQLGTLDTYKLFIAELPKYTSELSEVELLTLQKETLESLKKKKVSFEDLPALLHVNNLIYGSNNQYNHIVIDEAQDYGLFHFDALKETFPNSTFSIYGDLAQSIYSYRGVQDWESVSREIFDNNCSILNLKKSYRTTIEITDNANNILDYMSLESADPVIRHGSEVIYEEKTLDNNYKIDKIKELISRGFKTIAIICKTDKEAKDTFNAIKKSGLDIVHIEANNVKYSGGIFVLTSALSKGLEFDAVLINDASSKVYDETDMDDMHLLYVAATRALHELEILYSDELTKPLRKRLENDNKRVLKK